MPRLAEIIMLKIVEILQQKGTDHKTLLIASCSIYSFLTWISETNQTAFFKIRLDLYMLKILKYLKKMGQIIRRFSSFLVPYFRFLFESPRLTTEFSSRFLIKIVEIFQKKGIDYKTLLIASCSIYSFLTWISETNQTAFFKIRLDLYMLKIAKTF